MNGHVLPDPLTKRELEILQLVSKGLTNVEIGERLDITERTVRSHVVSIFSKLYVTNRTEAVVKAQWLGLVDITGALSPIAQTIALLLAIKPDALDELGLCRADGR